jgi:hypothetical protein
MQVQLKIIIYSLFNFYLELIYMHIKSYLVVTANSTTRQEDARTYLQLVSQ